MARPTKFKKEYCEQAHNYALLGATDAQLAEFFDVSETTINNWKIDHPEFLESLKIGKEETDNLVEQSLYRRAMGYSCTETKVFKLSDDTLLTKDVIKHYPPSDTAMIFWLKNRRPKDWRDVQKHIHEGAGEGMILDEVADMEIARRVVHLLEKAVKTNELKPH